MKKACCILLFFVLSAAASSRVHADDISVDTTTLLGIGKRDVAGSSKETLLPVTQFVTLSADKLGNSNLSFHLNGWGRADLADESYSDEKGAGSLTYGYFQYRFNYANADLRAGRFFVREGIINDQVDGFGARTDLPMGFGLSAFGGAVVHTAHLSGENSDGKGNTLFGGRANYRYKGLLEVGLSGVFESDAPALVTYTTGNYRRIGGDFWMAPDKRVDVTGHSSYNPETERFAEHSYLVNVKPAQHLVVTGTFNQHHEKSYLYSWTMFSAAKLNPADTSTSVGLSAAYEISKNLETVADYTYYSREFGSAARFGGEAKVNYKENSIRGGLAYHYLNAGEGFAIGSAASASYHELRCYLMRDTKKYFGAVDLLGDFFKESIYGKNSAWEVTTTLGYHITPALALSGDFSYGRNPQFTEEAKALLRMTYNLAVNGIGGKK